MKDLAHQGNQVVFPKPIPEDVVFVQKSGELAVLVVQERPGARAVRRVTDDPPNRFGAGAVHRAAKLPNGVAAILHRHKPGILSSDIAA